VVVVSFSNRYTERPALSVMTAPSEAWPALSVAPACCVLPAVWLLPGAALLLPLLHPVASKAAAVASGNRTSVPVPAFQPESRAEKTLICCSIPLHQPARRWAMSG
jgi:hypothetical protein